MFSLFKKKNTSEIKEVIFMHTNNKWQYCRNLLNKYTDALFIAWFNNTQNDFNDWMKQQGSLQQALLARQIASPMVAGKTIIFLEHYPIYSKEHLLMENWQAKEIYIVSALEEPLFRHFGGDKIPELLQQMGLQENEPLEHKLITQSIRNAQKKLEKQVATEHNSNSQEEWFRRNVGA